VLTFLGASINLQELLVSFRLVRYGEVVYRHCSEYYLSGMLETMNAIAQPDLSATRLAASIAAGLPVSRRRLGHA